MHKGVKPCLWVPKAHVRHTPLHNNLFMNLTNKYIGIRRFILHLQNVSIKLLLQNQSDGLRRSGGDILVLNILGGTLIRLGHGARGSLWLQRMLSRILYLRS